MSRWSRSGRSSQPRSAYRHRGLGSEVEQGEVGKAGWWRKLAGRRPLELEHRVHSTVFVGVLYILGSCISEGRTASSSSILLAIDPSHAEQERHGWFDYCATTPFLSVEKDEVWADLTRS